MHSKKTTKRALTMSVISMLICVAMLAGTTFAWFTDSVTSGVNRIVAGNLDVDVVFTGTDKSIANETELFSDVTLWEPGAVAYENLTVKNLGNLALKYNLAVNFDNENTVNGYGLSQVLKVGIVEGTVNASREAVLDAVTEWKPLNSFSADGALEESEAKDYTVVIWWEPTDEDNNWNVNNGKVTSDGEPLHIDLGVKLLATQNTVEEDSFDKQYDAMATVDNADELAAALTEKSVKIVLGADFALTEAIVIAADQTVAIDLAGHTMSHSVSCTASYAMITNKGSLTINDSVGSGKISFDDTGAGDPNVGWASYTISNSGTLVVNDGTVEHLGKQPYNGNNAIFHYTGSTTVNGGIIAAEYSRSLRQWQGDVTINGGSFRGQVWVQPMNTCDFTVTGGSFRPAANGNDSSSIFVTNASKTVNIDITGGELKTKLGMNTAVKCVSGGKFGVEPSSYLKDKYMTTTNPDGTYSVVEGTPVASMTELKEAINNGAKVVDAKGENLGDFNYSAVFKDGVTVKNAKFSYFYGGNVEGTVTFENCEFVSDHSYSANFDSGNGKVIFNNCLFDGWSSFGTAITGVEMNKCTFRKTYNYGILRFYQNAVINNCVFEDTFEGVDTNVTGTKVEFKGCTGIDGKIFNNGSEVGVWIVDGTDISDSVTSW